MLHTRTNWQVGVRRAAAALSRPVRRWPAANLAAPYPALASAHGTDVRRRAGSTRWSRLGKACRRHCGSASTAEDVRSSRHEPTRKARTPCVTDRVTHRRALSVVARACPVCGGTPPSSRSIYCKTGLQATRVSSASPTASHRRSGHPSQATPAPAAAGGAYGLRVSAVWRALPRRAAVYKCQLYCGALGLGGQCADCDTSSCSPICWNVGWRQRFLRRSARNGYGHDALFTQSLDNPCGGRFPT